MDVFSRIKLDDLSMPTFGSKKEQKENRKLQAERFLEEIYQNRDSTLIQDFILLHQQGLKPTKESLFKLTEQVFLLLDFEKVHQDLSKFIMVFRNSKGGQDIYITFTLDQKSDLISLTGYQFQPQSQINQIDINVMINKDILSYLINQINSQIPYFTIEYSTQRRLILCQTSTIGQLDENYVNWLFLNIDAVTIASLETTTTFFQMYQNGNGPSESVLISEKCKNRIKQRVDSNKDSYNQFIKHIEREFPNSLQQVN